MALFSDGCKIYAVRPVGDRVFSVLPLLDFFLLSKICWQLFFNRCHTISFKVASLGFLSGRYGKFIMKWRLPGADFRG